MKVKLMIADEPVYVYSLKELISYKEINPEGCEEVLRSLIQCKNGFENSEAFDKFIFMKNEKNFYVTITHHFPQLTDEFIQCALNNDALYQKIFDSRRAFCFFANHYPHYKKLLIEAILNNPERCNKLFKVREDIYPLIGIFSVEDLLKNPTFSTKLPKTMGEFNKFARTYFDQAEIWIPHVLSNPERRKKILASLIDWLQLYEILPGLVTDLLPEMLQDKDQYLSLFSVNAEIGLKSLAIKFPEYIEALFSPIFEDTNIYKKVIKEMEDLHLLASAFPQYEDKFFKPLMGDVQLFEKIFINTVNLAKTAEKFPEKAIALIQFYLKHFDQCDLFLKNNAYVCYLVDYLLKSYESAEIKKLFPEYPAKFINYILDHPSQLSSAYNLLESAKFFPTYKNQFYVLAMKNGYEEIIRETSDICSLAEAFPEYAGELIHDTLSKKGEFERIVNGIYDIYILSKTFPERRNEILARGEHYITSAFLSSMKELKDFDEIEFPHFLSILINAGVVTNNLSLFTDFFVANKDDFEYLVKNKKYYSEFSVIKEILDNHNEAIDSVKRLKLR